jgi:hypothetical protein
LLLDGGSIHLDVRVEKIKLKLNEKKREETGRERETFRDFITGSISHQKLVFLFSFFYITPVALDNKRQLSPTRGWKNNFFSFLFF